METNGLIKSLPLLFILAAVLHLPSHSLCQKRSIDPVVQGKIDEFIKNIYFPAAKISNLGLSVVQNDGDILYTTGYGFADQEKGIPNGNNTQFLIASVTKSFTALATIKILSEKFPELGEAVLDTPIRKLLPQINFTLSDRFRSEQATFRDLLSHRMCLLSDGMIMGADPLNSTEEFLFRQRYAPQTCGFRSEYQYNNHMYVIAGELAGQLKNQSYKDMVKELIAEIGMDDSDFVLESDDFSNMPYRAMPYYVKDNISHPYNTNLIKRYVKYIPAGGLFVPPNDIEKYMRFHLNLGSINGKQIIPESVMGWMTKPGVTFGFTGYKSSDDDRIITPYGYGLGLAILSYDGWKYFAHNGDLSPYTCYFSLFPSQKLGIFTSTNQGPALASAEALHLFIFETLRGVENATEKALKVTNHHKTKLEREKLKSQELVDEFINKGKLSKLHQNPADIVGKYGSGSAGELEVSEKFNEQTNSTGVYFSYGRWATGWVEGFGDNRYFITWDTDLSQDNYANGLDTDGMYVAVTNGTMELFFIYGTESLLFGIFQLGVSLSTLPPVPWNPESCGAE